MDAILAAESYESHFDEKIPFFEACLPIEELARRGRETLRFGPLKPVGLDGSHERAAGRTRWSSSGRKTCARPATTWSGSRTT